VELKNKKISIVKNDGSSVGGLVTNENHVFIFLKVVRKINGGTMESEEIISRNQIDHYTVIE
jgi:hypothetical protein